MRRIILLCLLACCTTAVMAADSGPTAVKAALERMAPGVKIGQIQKAPMPGFYQALIGGRMVYVSADGAWIMDGTLYNADQRVDLSERSMRAVRRKALAAEPTSAFITFAPAHPRYTVTVFTDLDCGYCRVLHKHMDAINAEGIAVRYLAWPRSGIKAVPSGKPTAAYLKAVSVWCAKDRKSAFTAAMGGAPVTHADCSNPVAREFQLGEHMGVNGTPTIIAADGTVLGGYLPPKSLLHVLQQLGKKKKAG